ncbi:hypothetical protein TSAR_010674 [Trichomalopsis sarcophagae]|uniref:PSP proline-rich domain-containing protein n=1 Tax=Trichomalopsis sarcophagae TaxID=543379 RepID=A0A232F0Q7_9HYME|nr:hypothetical protein TSAR_010674 [Trichomalopsis sarcophagae]
MTSPQSSPASPTEVITLDTSLEESISQNDCINETNLSEIILDTTDVIFDGTLAPGAAPPGFVVIDEEREPPTPMPKRKKKTEPILKVVFRDPASFRSYHKKIECFLKELISSKSSKRKVATSIEDLVLQIFDAKDEHGDPSELDSSISIIEDKHPNDLLFTIENEPKMQDDLDIPMYGKACLEKPKEDREIKEDFGPKMTCFNCMGNHSLRDCDLPRNYLNINKNRKEHAAKRGPTNSRYHLEDDQKYGHFVPGQISSNLRRALGLMDDELPRHIYRMRSLGYPPGWLEEARQQHSGLSLFDDAGKAAVNSDEEGEIICPGDRDKYDIKKIIDFPGFNVANPEGVHDEGMEYWGSSVQIQSSKNAMISYLSHKQVDDGYKRKKMPNAANAIVRTDVNPGEMEIDEVEDTRVECVPVKNLFIPPLPKDNGPELPPPPPGVDDSESPSQEDLSNHSNDESTAPSSRNDSPSLVDLETKHKQLLAELDESSSHSNPDSTKTKLSNPGSAETEVPEVESANAKESDSNKINVNNSTPKNGSKTQTIKIVKSIHLGTPILKSASPFRKLPSSEKFSKDICDVINFENLPDATGKYDQMSELLQKVRSAVAEFQKE